jgi:hypothetical protein
VLLGKEINFSSRTSDKIDRSLVMACHDHIKWLQRIPSKGEADFTRHGMAMRKDMYKDNTNK